MTDWWLMHNIGHCLVCPCGINSDPLNAVSLHLDFIITFNCNNLQSHPKAQLHNRQCHKLEFLPHLWEDVGAVSVVTVLLAVVGDEVRTSKDGTRGGKVFLCAHPLAILARALCRQMAHLAPWGLKTTWNATPCCTAQSWRQGHSPIFALVFKHFSWLINLAVVVAGAFLGRDTPVMINVVQ